MGHNHADVWTLHLVAAPGFGPTTTAQRVRRALKFLLRSFGLRCIRVTGPTAEDLADLAREERTPARNKG
jgi:hypothetical protein